jgi:hypothetical protein
VGRETFVFRELMAEADERIPKKLNTRHKSLALAVATGNTVKKAAELIGVHENWAYIVSRSPAFKALVAKYFRELERETIKEAKQKILSEALNSVNVLVELRDTASSESVRLQAAQDLLDRAIPKAVKNENDNTLRISLPQELMAQMRGANPAYQIVDGQLEIPTHAEVTEALAEEARAAEDAPYLIEAGEEPE